MDKDLNEVLDQHYYEKKHRNIVEQGIRERELRKELDFNEKMLNETKRRTDDNSHINNTFEEGTSRKTKSQFRATNYTLGGKKKFVAKPEETTTTNFHTTNESEALTTKAHTKTKFNLNKTDTTFKNNLKKNNFYSNEHNNEYSPRKGKNLVIKRHIKTDKKKKKIREQEGS